MLLAGAISDTVFNATTDFVADGGLIGIFVLMLLDAACIPVPSEITMLFGGFTVSQGHQDLIAVTAVGRRGTSSDRGWPSPSGSTAASGPSAAAPCAGSSAPGTSSRPIDGSIATARHPCWSRA
jgi:hypothetical protein